MPVFLTKSRSRERDALYLIPGRPTITSRLAVTVYRPTSSPTVSGFQADVTCSVLRRVIRVAGANVGSSTRLQPVQRNEKFEGFGATL
jgi:hypothetical protein